MQGKLVLNMMGKTGTGWIVMMIEDGWLGLVWFGLIWFGLGYLPIVASTHTG